MTAALEFLRRATDFLGQRGVANPRLDAEVLLADVLGVDRVGVYLNFERVLSEDEVSRYRDRVRRRARREPLQHIRGVQEFHSREFQVDRRVLVPRADTETLVDEALEALRGRRNARVLDVGSGSGVIAVTLALEAPDAEVLAVDFSPDAVEVGRANSERLGARVEFRCGDLLSPFAGERFDLIVSNPPYVSRTEIDLLEPEVRDFDPREALDGGPDGLDFFRRLSAAAAGALANDGVLAVEVGAGQSDAVGCLLEKSGFRETRKRRDLSGVERVVSAKRGS